MKCTLYGRVKLFSIEKKWSNLNRFPLLGTTNWGHTTRLDAYIDDKPSIVLVEPYNPITVAGNISKLLFYGGRENETETFI